ncbi:MAG TPA: response regulator, partial [Terracidiphilus sp.]|nr:response regulator [Terracidiphilus sp.]
MPTILLVDNDPLQALVRKSSLEKRFGDVERVSDPAEALCLIEQPQFASHLRLVISGLHTSGIAGADFVAELHSRLPSVPVLVLGDGDQRAADYDVEGVRLLSRPYASDQVLAAASQMMDKST